MSQIQIYCYSLLLITFSLIPAAEVNAQIQPLEWELEASANAATNKHQPFWIYSNRYAEIDPASTGGTGRLSALIPWSSTGNFPIEFSAGAELHGRASAQESLLFRQIFLKLKWKILQLSAGRFKEQTGSAFHPLSMGSLSISGNATPMPKIKVGIPEYTPLPLTDGLIQIKGAIAHGWFEKDRVVQKPWLHEKYGYANFGGDFPLNIYGGIVHSTTWAGYRESLGGELPDGLDEFIKVFFVTGGDEEAPDGDDYYFLGDHRGYWDFGATYEHRSFDLQIYRHFILNDKDNVKFKSPQDGLYGLVIQPKGEQELVTAFLYEFLYTKWQNGPEEVEAGRGNAGGWDDYYNNFIYNTGWSYFGNTLGNPLFLTYGHRAMRNSDISYNGNRYIANNRIVAHHLGVSGQLSDHIEYRLFYTWSRNSGTYRAADRSLEADVDYLFEPPLEQSSILLETKTQLKENLLLNLSLAADIGQLYEDSFGVLVGLQWNGVLGLR